MPSFQCEGPKKVNDWEKKRAKERSKERERKVCVYVSESGRVGERECVCKYKQKVFYSVQEVVPFQQH